MRTSVRERRHGDATMLLLTATLLAVMTLDTETLCLITPSSWAEMQQLVKAANNAARFKDVTVPERELHKPLEEVKAARDGASFLLNGV